MDVLHVEGIVYDRTDLRSGFQQIRPGGNEFQDAIPAANAKARHQGIGNDRLHLALHAQAAVGGWPQAQSVGGEIDAHRSRDRHGAIQVEVQFGDVKYSPFCFSAKDVPCTEQPSHLQGRWPGQDLLEGARLQDPATIEQGKPVGDPQGLRPVVGHVQHGHARFPLQ